MKKILCIALSIAVLLSLAGCSLQDLIPELPVDLPTQADPAPSDAPSAPDAPTDAPEAGNPVRGTPMTAVLLESCSEEEYADDGTVLFTYSYPAMTIVSGNSAAAMAISTNFLTAIFSRSGQADSIRDMAIESYDPGFTWYRYTYSEDYTPCRVDGSVISLCGHITVYAGGVHPSHLIVSDNYNAATGQRLALSNILADEDAPNKLQDMVVSKLSDPDMGYFLYEDYRDVVADRFADSYSANGNWYFSSTGLCFYFSTYEIAPYSVGNIVVELPYAQLGGILADVYFPGDAEDAGGQLLFNLSGEAEQTFNQVARIDSSPDGPSYFLYTDSGIADVKLERGHWLEYDQTFQVDATLLYAGSLSSADAIFLREYISEALPSLRISYQSGGSHYSFYLVSSDGVPSLQDAASG